MRSSSDIAIHWMRRDLRLQDNTGLCKALESGLPVLCVFIFDRQILDRLEDKMDKRVIFIHQALRTIQEQLQAKGSTLDVRYGDPSEVWQDLLEEYSISSVFANEDYEPYARNRDEKITHLLAQRGIELHLHKDHVLAAKSEVVKGDGLPYTVFTPYSRRWRQYIDQHPVKPASSEALLDQLLPHPAKAVPSLASMGFESAGVDFPTATVENSLLQAYANRRDIPGIEGTSRLGVHLRFGTVSLRQLYLQAKEESDTFVNELIWRDFYQMVLWHFPHTVARAFRSAYDHIPWRNDEEDFESWKQGQTGYALVDAGMRQLKETGYMHNRVRMLVASFLTKHLLIDWKWGERHFARYLLDFDLASNVGGWQWAAGCGTDAAPYFRVFNPHTQLKKFDPKLEYARRWVREIDTLEYMQMSIVEHKFGRERALSVYKSTLEEYKMKNL